MLRGAALCAVVTAAHGATDLELARERLAASDCEGVLEPLNRSVRAGEPAAYHLTGVLLSKGLCVGRDVKRALPFLETAATHGNTESAEYLILLHGLGRGVPQSFVEAEKWSRRARAYGTNPEDVQPAEAAGWSWTVHARARELFVLDRSAPPSITNMRFSIVATLTPSGTVEYEVLNRGEGGRFVDPQQRRIMDSHLASLKAAYDVARAEVPPPGSLANGPVQREYEVSYR